MSARRLKENGQDSDGFKQKIKNESDPISSHLPSITTSEIRSSNGIAGKSTEPSLLSSTNQQKQVKSEPVDDEYLDGNVGNSMRNMDSEASIQSQIHLENMRSGTIDEHVYNQSMNPWSHQFMPPHQYQQFNQYPNSVMPSHQYQQFNQYPNSVMPSYQYQQFDQHPNSVMPSYQYQQFNQHPNSYEQRNPHVPWISWRKPSDIPSTSSQMTSVGIPGNSNVSIANMDSESAHLLSTMHSKNGKSGVVIQKDGYNESMNRLSSTSECTTTTSSGIADNSKMSKRKMVSEASIQSKIHLKKVKKEEIDDDGYGNVPMSAPTMPPNTVNRTEFPVENNKIYFNAINVTKVDPGFDKFHWITNAGKNTRFRALDPSEEPMNFIGTPPKMIHKFFVEKEHVEQVENFIAKKNWVNIFNFSYFKSCFPFIWHPMSHEQILHACILATKAYGEGEKNLDHEEMQNRLKNDDEMIKALGDDRVQSSIRDILTPDGLKMMDELCRKHNVTIVHREKPKRKRIRNTGNNENKKK